MKQRQEPAESRTDRDNATRAPRDCAAGQKVLLKMSGISRKAVDEFSGPFAVTQVHANGTVRIQRGTISERLNIRRITPHYERQNTLQ